MLHGDPAVIRRQFLKVLGSLPLAYSTGLVDRASARPGKPIADRAFRRVRPSDPQWPAPAKWQRLKAALKGELIEVRSPLKDCAGTGSTDAPCAKLFKDLKNPYFIGDHPGLTQTLGWADAWTSQPSVYAVAAESAADVAAAVNFAREHKLRLAIRGGGHSTFGNSAAPDSLLIWTRRMNRIEMHDAFVGQGCAGKTPAKPAVSVGAGCIWMHVYQAVMARGGRYVQGGSCATVGVAGLVQSGGFGSFSKKFGTTAGSLLEAEIVTADGRVLIANACTNPELFWGLKGGGGGSLGVVTRLTLETHTLPATLGICAMTIRAASDGAFRKLIERVVAFYAETLLNPNWGEKISIRPDRTIEVNMVAQGLGEGQMRATWRPLLDWIRATPELSLANEPRIAAIPGRQVYDPAVQKTVGLVLADDRPGAPPANVFWTGDQAEAGQFIHAYHSAWMPVSLMKERNQDRIVQTLYAAAQHSAVHLHCSKGLAGAPAEAIARAKDTAMNPAVLDAFALLTVASYGEPQYPGIAGRAPDLELARARVKAVNAAIAEIYKLVPKARAGAYVAESNYFDPNWQQSYWGSNYPRLQAVKKSYDPDNLFFVHNGVGSENWSSDGFSSV